MLPKLRIEAVDRREVVLGAAAAAALLALAGPRDRAQAQSVARFNETFDRLVGAARPQESGRVVIELPEIAENGNTVPIAISVASPMSSADHVTAIHILSTSNPQPWISSFHFTPDSGKAAVATRIRLAQSQDVVVLAAQSSGQVFVARRSVKVTIGGCGG